MDCIGGLSARGARCCCRCAAAAGALENRSGSGIMEHVEKELKQYATGSDDKSQELNDDDGERDVLAEEQRYTIHLQYAGGRLK